MLQALRTHVAPHVPPQVRATLRRWRGPRQPATGRAAEAPATPQTPPAPAPAKPAAKPAAEGLRASTAPVGSLALVDPFFDRFPAFYESSETSTYWWRLNLRRQAIFAWDPSIFRGARVLDIASHDGRWSMAALEAGAEHVVGIEAKPDLVESAESNFAAYDVDPSRFRFLTGDVFEVLAKPQFQVDVVLCLGFFYHTLRHHELLARVRATGARHVVIDTEVHRARQPLIRVGSERIARQGNAVADEFSVDDIVLTGRPSVPAMRLMARGHGMQVDGLADWAGLLRDNPEHSGLGDYAAGERVTVHLSRTTGA